MVTPCESSPRSLTEHHDWANADILSRRGVVGEPTGSVVPVTWDDGSTTRFDSEYDFAAGVPKKGDLLRYLTSESPCLCGQQHNLRLLLPSGG